MRQSLNLFVVVLISLQSSAQKQFTSEQEAAMMNEWMSDVDKEMYLHIEQLSIAYPTLPKAY